ncbi:hypothetical protein V6N13_109065 [Hibiscus sabdariffa]
MLLCDHCCVSFSREVGELPNHQSGDIDQKNGLGKRLKLLSEGPVLAVGFRNRNEIRLCRSSPKPERLGCKKRSRQRRRRELFQREKNEA